jgi:hypothetical protein
MIALMQNFKVLLKPFLETLIGTCWMQFKNQFSLYKKSEIDGEECDEIEKEKEDNPDYSLINHTESFFDYLLSLLPFKAFKKLIKENMAEFLLKMIDYIQITCDQDETWSQDISVYLQENDVDQFSSILRCHFMDFIEEICSSSSTEFVNALLGPVLQAVLQNSTDYKAMEAYLHTLEISSDYVKEAEIPFQWSTFANQVILPSLKAGKYILNFSG